MNEIPIKEQMTAMVMGNTMQLLDKYLPNHGHNVREYLSVTSIALQDFLSGQPQLVNDYFERHRPTGTLIHEVDYIDFRAGRYDVFDSLHGERTNLRSFEKLLDAVVCHVLITHGLSH